MPLSTLYDSPRSCCWVCWLDLLWLTWMSFLLISFMLTLCHSHEEDWMQIQPIRTSNKNQTLMSMSVYSYSTLKAVQFIQSASQLKCKTTIRTRQSLDWKCIVIAWSFFASAILCRAHCDTDSWYLHYHFLPQMKTTPPYEHVVSSTGSLLTSR